jgi:lipoprotein-anchoring transpeptidase ErfK/SrfK
LAVLCLAAGTLLAVTLPAGAQDPPPATTDTTASTPATTSAPTTTAAPTTTPTTTTTPKPPKKPRRPVRLPARVSIGGIHVGGLAPLAAYRVLNAAFHAPLVIVVDRTRVRVSPKKLGAVAYVRNAVSRARNARPGSRIELKVVVRGSKLRTFVDDLTKQFEQKAVDATLVLRKLKPFISDGHPGRRLDRNDAVKTLVSALRENRRTGIGLPFKEIAQKVTRDSFGPVIVIRRESKRLYLYQGVKFKRVFGVATGQSVYPTPLGRFEVVVMWRNPWWYPPDSPWAKGAKPIPPGPGNPLGTRWMGLSAPGVGIHGTPDDASIGYSASHGCIRMHISEAEWLFEHVEIGSPVFIVPV